MEACTGNGLARLEMGMRGGRHVGGAAAGEDSVTGARTVDHAGVSNAVATLRGTITPGTLGDRRAATTPTAHIETTQTANAR
jgi:hypothetical protein